MANPFLLQEDQDSNSVLAGHSDAQAARDLDRVRRGGKWVRGSVEGSTLPGVTVSWRHGAAWSQGVSADQSGDWNMSPRLLPAEPAGSHVLVLGTYQHFSKTCPQARTLHPHAWDGHKETRKGRAEGLGSNKKRGKIPAARPGGTVLPHRLPAARIYIPH